MPRASAWLAGKGMMLQGCRDLRHEAKSTGFFQKAIMKKRKPNKRVPKFSCTDNGFMRKLPNRLAHTFTYFANLGC
jgi:hypothetical protein